MPAVTTQGILPLQLSGTVIVGVPVGVQVLSKIHRSNRQRTELLKVKVKEVEWSGLREILKVHKSRKSRKQLLIYLAVNHSLPYADLI